MALKETGDMRHVAAFNVARMRAPLEDPLMSGFAQALDRINAVADASPGFIWRLIGEDPNDPAIVSLGPSMLVNLSVWTDLPALSAYVYRSSHVEIFRRRSEWFLPLGAANAVLWHVERGHIPSLQEAVDRLRQLQTEGPSTHAFTFKQPAS
jgi:hypothetical protein